MLNGQIINTAARATRALFDRVLGGAGIAFAEWACLNMLATGGPDGLVDRLAGGLLVERAAAEAVLAAVRGRGLVAGEPAALTEAGQALFDRVRAEAAAITAGLYRDLPTGDLETAGRVLVTVTARAEAALAA